MKQFEEATIVACAHWVDEETAKKRFKVMFPEHYKVFSRFPEEYQKQLLNKIKTDAGKLSFEKDNAPKLSMDHIKITRVPEVRKAILSISQENPKLVYLAGKGKLSEIEALAYWLNVKRRSGYDDSALSEKERVNLARWSLFILFNHFIYGIARS